MAIKFNDKSDWLGLRIEEVKHGYYVPNCFNNDGICIDIGANVGAFPIVYGNLFEKVYCYEPALYSYNECVKNVKSLNNVETFNLAVTNKSGEIVKLRSMKGTGNVSGNASIIANENWDDDNFEYVKTISFIDVIRNTNIINKKNYIKIDAECSEYEMLMDNDLSMINFLAIEIHIQLGIKKMNELMAHLSKFFNVMVQKGGGHSHYGITYQNKNLKL